MLSRSAVVLLCVAAPVVLSLQCMVGWAPFKPGGLVYNATVQTCPSTAKCCAYSNSIPGEFFSCSSECGSTGNFPECHPTAEELARGFMGGSFCYCKDHTDAKCHNDWIKANVVHTQSLVQV